MLLQPKSVLHPRLRPSRASRAALWAVLAVWGGSTLAAMWWLNPVSPASLSICTSSNSSSNAAPFATSVAR
ncbi:hypothetical protein [Rhodoferax sp.]|uniref:hypothetical protein n=1 Tax=Rhodoferax sp. TaxID=50421 RepID=UPI0025F353AC|nr:hypothetical protein [Rhodoferax sp.]